MTVAAVVLAAGEASRFGTPKQRLLLPEVLERLEQSPVDEIVVVAGAHTLETPAHVVTCAGWKRGPGASLACGLEELGDDVEAAVVVLADGPDLAPEAVERVIDSWRADDGVIVAASYGGERGHPLLVARTDDLPSFDSASRHQGAHRSRPVVAAGACVDLWRAAEFASDEHGR